MYLADRLFLKLFIKRLCFPEYWAMFSCSIWDSITEASFVDFKRSVLRVMQ